MSIYQTEHKSKFYLFVFFIAASFLAWGLITQYKPMIIRTNCSEVAAKSSGLLSAKRYNLETDFSYKEVKSDCVKTVLSRK
ncbi:hypothetical protein A2863_00920 [Candidatus Woesebacteria bacterium RIFCSPHIGHO2_01_FULL_38_9b]|uniref:Uncharacterized protein n=1 Tax=Candidatus Woesebacteria bacterium RIFCSPHIGHO2_01_FULL_38_9b TaxID=1802493 RepID=A0A1F7Y5N0_9BACT|nr:MAG: hypothetical protein A2863_00920 [Candidatus Woesebacteria bacterium RIFCSPHIGHO2_01_FULL_38_9b]